MELLKKTKLLSKVCAGALLAVSIASYSSPAPYHLSSLESYLIRSFAWEQYESFVNTGSSTLFDNPKVYYFTAGTLAKNVIKNPVEFLKKFNGQRVFIHGILSRYSPTKSSFILETPEKSFTINIQMSSDETTETHPISKKSFYCRVSGAKKNEILLNECISGTTYQEIKTAEIEQGIKNFLSGKDKQNPNMPTYAMLAYMALVSARILPYDSVCKEAVREEAPYTGADIRACNQEITDLWQSTKNYNQFNEAMDSVERDLARHGADLNLVRQAASLMD